MSTVSKAMSILEVFSHEYPEMGLSEISRRLKYNKATTLRLLNSMLSFGLVEKTDPGKLYRIGPAVHRLASIRSDTLAFAELAQPILDRLRNETGESCHISEASQNEMATVLLAHSAKSLRVNFSVGEKLPFHCTASGIAYLSKAREGVLQRVTNGPLPKITSRSKTTPRELVQQVKEAQNRSFSINNGEFDEEAISVAAPLLDVEGYAFAAISVAAPTSRTDQKLSARHGNLVMRAARDISLAVSGKSTQAKHR